MNLSTIKGFLKNRLIIIGYIPLLLPHMFVFYLHQNKHIIKKDIYVWKKRHSIPGKYIIPLLLLLIHYKEFRTLFYFRIGAWSNILNIFLPKLDSLYIGNKKIGGGCFIMHGFSTILYARCIGANFCVFQQVTVGLNNSSPDGPIIGNNVTIYAGALVLGNITIGNNAIIGAGSVVIKNLPDNCTVVGNPARIVKRDGKKITEML